MGYALTQKLIDYKHTNIACLMKPKSLRSQLVFEGFKKCLFDNHIPFTDDMIITSSNQHYYSLISAHNITGIVSTHFASALTLYEQIDNLHCHIPSDLSLVSLQDDVREAITFPRISSIKIPYQEFGMYVCSNLITKCEQKEVSNKDFCFSTTSEFLHEKSIQEPAAFRTKKLVVVGSINLDITFNVNELPQAGKAITIHSSSVTLGGKGANQAIGAKKLGCEVALIGKIGNDYESVMVYDMLKQKNLLTRGISRDIKSETGKAYIYVKSTSESAITLLPGANGTLTTTDIQKQQYLFEHSGFCLVSAELPLDTILEAISIAKKHKAKVIMKPATLKTFSDSLANYVDIFVPNKIEASILCPNEKNIEKQADYFLKMGIPIVIITLGEQGCYLKTKNLSRYFPASDFIAIDTTGGADAFIATLASYLIMGYQLENAIQIATYAAGFCVSRQGVVPSLIDRNSLENHIRMVNPKLLL